MKLASKHGKHGCKIGKPVMIKQFPFYILMETAVDMVKLLTAFDVGVKEHITCVQSHSGLASLSHWMLSSLYLAKVD